VKYQSDEGQTNVNIGQKE